jgi:hypothetical protein
MIVAAIDRRSESAPGTSLFDAIAARHQMKAEEYCVVTQPDHARLSGAFAAALDRARFPCITDEIVQAITDHDIGWLKLDGAAPGPILPPYEPDGRLRSFLTTPPKLFLQAWTGSIAHAEQIGPTAGAMVSRHFELLAQFRLQRSQDAPEDISRLHYFLAQESSRQHRLGAESKECSSIDLLQFLQFCDLVSLSFCCGVEGSVEFPQNFGAGPVTIAKRNGVCELRGVPLRSRIEAECPAYRWRPGSPILVLAPIQVHVEYRAE